MQSSYDDSLIWFVHKANLLLKSNLQKELKDFNITTEQWGILNELYRQDRCNQKELANKCYKDQAALTRILDLLEKRELINREKSPNDRREFLIIITSMGQQLVNQIRPHVQESIERTHAMVSDEERYMLKSLLKKLIVNLG
ncbi:MAG TPA: MarR family transcriptional regulator [Desulfosporosinus sp.]